MLPTDVYDITYEYDNGGNRTLKEDAVSNTRVEYHYDLEDPSEYDSKNNQLMYYQEFDTSGPGDPVLVSTTWYYYTFMGNVERVVTSAKDSEFYESTWFRYAVNDQTATMIIGETWNWNGVDPPDPQSYDITYGREFRYDQARARYLTRVLDPDDLEDGNLTTVSKVWSDYDGDVVYGDYTVSFTVPTNVRSYEPGMGKVEPWTSMGAASTSYYSTDMLGTTRYMTTPDDGQKERGGATGGGLATEGATYTAFGERICTLDDSCGPTDPNPRYGYAGAHGYRAQDTAEDPGSDPVPFLHVGHRYYDPAIGRFLQRDPIGIDGGLNVYAYVGNSPTSLVDPSGLDVFTDIFDAIDGFINGELFGWGAGGTGAYQSAKYKWRKLPFAKVANRFMAVEAGAIMGWNFGKWLYPRAIRPMFDFLEKHGMKKFGDPFNPSNPWGWAGGTSWARPRAAGACGARTVEAPACFTHSM